MIDIIYVAVTLFSTFIGAISGMGGGVIMKPVFDLAGAYSASEISVLTSCTMLAMSLTSVISSAGQIKAEKENIKTIVTTAAGSLLGGLAGNEIFSRLVANSSDTAVKIIQNSVLLAFVVAIIIYMRGEGKSLNIKKAAAGIPVGIMLGTVSAFLGIGGGPINVTVLTVVFGMGIKTAVICSLSSVLLSQGAKTVSVLIQGGAEPFLIKILPFMIAAGIIGAVIGRALNKRAGEKTVKKLFIAVQILVVFICIFNIVRFAIS